MAEFFEKYPEGSFQSDMNFAQVDDRWVAIVKASAYRFPDDPRPGNGLAFEFIPGKTPYTRDSELQNAETAAWGRAVMAVGAGDSKKPIATREEVRNRTTEPDNVIDNLKGRQALRDVCEEKGLNPKVVATRFKVSYGQDAKLATDEDLMSFVNLIRSGALNPDPDPEPITA
ncbi:hypothetical protein [Mycobacterium intracellulare]|uniref:hypothetical protein n=1 Tax=Mycobacterium intracellulare TaxID=1767 RepID=UPI0019259D7B|nr:hypothetical protein [Mycobacterium intracellulare]